MAEETSKDVFNALGQPSQHLHSPVEVAQTSVAATLDLAAKVNSPVVLTLGERHPVLSHQVTEALTLKELVAQGQTVTLLMEYPHNRLDTLLIDRGYGASDAAKLAAYMNSSDPKGHLTAKGVIGGNTHSRRGGNFHGYDSHLLLQAGIHHDVNIAYVDAARTYPADFCMDYSDQLTREIAQRINARRAPSGETGPDDMLLRNTCMAEVAAAHLSKNGGIGLLAVGGAHSLGAVNAANGQHSYKDSLSPRFQKINLPAVIVAMQSTTTLPPDYQPGERGQIHLFMQPGPQAQTQNLTPAGRRDFLAENGLDPMQYDPQGFAGKYRAEFDVAVRNSARVLGIKEIRPPSTRTAAFSRS